MPPFENGIVSTAVIQYTSTDSVTFGGSTLTIQSLKIDTIDNLPNGLCWSTSSATNTFVTPGCIKINGTTCSAPGQYKLRVAITVNVGVPISTVSEAAGWKFFVRVQNQGGIAWDVDTTQTNNNPFIPYGPAISGCTAPDTFCHALYSLYPDTSTPHKWWAVNQSTSIMALDYLWHWGDGDTSSGAMPSHIYAAPGNYNICLTVSDSTGCTDTYCDSSTYIYKTENIISVQVVNQLPTGISVIDILSSKIRISPNPFTGKATVSFFSTENKMLVERITNLLGEEIYTREIEAKQGENKFSINAQNLSAGIYFYSLCDGKATVAKRIVIEP